MDQFITACKNGDISTVKCLLPTIDLSANDKYAVIWASRYGYVELIRLLLTDPRFDPSFRDNEAIQLAVLYGRTDVVRLLVADPRVDSSILDNWAINAAKRDGNTKLVDLLTEYQFRLDGPEYNRNILT
uniref:Uncharacterized protein n=1 Tax=viral metagenome TaxID=1070528 RepID=A0A6C0JXA3_9ZZZZ